jgi:hypothetical protein
MDPLFVKDQPSPLAAMKLAVPFPAGLLLLLNPAPALTSNDVLTPLKMIHPVYVAGLRMLTVLPALLTVHPAETELPIVPPDTVH